MKNIVYLVFISALIVSCDSTEDKTYFIESSAPIARDGGAFIEFHDEKAIDFFETETVGYQNINADFKAPGKIAANVFASDFGGGQKIFLFDDEEVSSSYTQLVQSKINIQQIQSVTIKQKELELARAKELQGYGAATGQDVLSAKTELAMEKTELANEKASLLEHEAELKSAGFRAELLERAKPGTAYLVCDIPENQIAGIKEGQKCSALFTAYPKDTIHAQIDAITDRIDSETRMLKVRISLDNSSGKYKTGMFANVLFEHKQDDIIAINQNALVTIQGKHYVFVKKSTNEFERREVQIGQQIGDQAIIYSGLEIDEQIAVKGVMQLKGLAFGY